MSVTKLASTNLRRSESFKTLSQSSFRTSHITPFTSIFSHNTSSPSTRQLSTKLSKRSTTKHTTTVTASASQQQQQTMTRPWLIIGGGRVGEAFADMGTGNDKIIRRGEPITGLNEGPIVVCTRNDALQGVVDATPPERRKDLVFIQNGMLQPWLDSQGLGDNTQLLVYFAVAKKGDKPTDGVTDLNPEGLTAATGPYAAEIAERLTNSGLGCKVLNAQEFKKPMLEKLIWISAFMLVGARHGGVTVGEVESQYRDEVETLINELGKAGSAALGVDIDDGAAARLRAYARSVAHFPTAVKEFEWRNGWFYELSKKAVESGKEDPCPRHTDWLKEVKAI